MMVEIIDDIMRQRFQIKINEFLALHPHLSIKKDNFFIKTSRKLEGKTYNYMATIVYEEEKDGDSE